MEEYKRNDVTKQKKGFGSFVKKLPKTDEERRVVAERLIKENYRALKYLEDK